MDEKSEGKRQFNECMDKTDPKDCTSIKVRGNYKGFRNLKLQVVIMKQSEIELTFLSNMLFTIFADYLDQSRAMESIWCENCDRDCDNKEVCNI